MRLNQFINGISFISRIRLSKWVFISFLSTAPELNRQGLEAQKDSTHPLGDPAQEWGPDMGLQLQALLPPQGPRSPWALSGGLLVPRQGETTLQGAGGTTVCSVLMGQSLNDASLSQHKSFWDVTFLDLGRVLPWNMQGS